MRRSRSCANPPVAPDRELADEYEEMYGPDSCHSRAWYRAMFASERSEEEKALVEGGNMGVASDGSAMHLAQDGGWDGCGEPFLD